MSKRSEIVRIARAEIGSRDAAKYWAGIGFAPPYPRHWCGAFALWCLKQAGVAQEAKWAIGGPYGFLYLLPRLTVPRPGDIGYIDQPYQHHFVVEDYVGIYDTLNTIDGNSGAPSEVRTHARRLSDATYYDISKFLGGDCDVSC